MNTFINIFLAAILFYSTSCLSQSECKITYISNEGFLIETANNKILVDALFGGFTGNWCDIPNDEIQLKLENADSPFNNVDIIAISHRHSDHFNPEIVMKHIANNPNCIVICPKQVDSILSSQQDYNKFKKNIFAVTPFLYNDTVLKIIDVEIKVLKLEHSHYYEKDEITGEKINIHKNTENIGFLFKTEGIKIFHCGDSNPMDDAEYKNFNLISEKIDIAFLDRLFMYHISAEGIELICNYINPENIVLMHIEPNKSQKYKDVAAQIKDNIPNIYFFDKPMDEKKFTIIKNK